MLDPSSGRTPVKDRANTREATYQAVGLAAYGSVTATPLSFEFASLHEVKALHKMLMSLKFDHPEEVFFGSPFIAAVQHRLLSLLIDADSAGGRGAARTQWEQWRQAENHPHELAIVRRHLEENVEVTSAWAPGQRRAYVRDLLAPLIVSDPLLAELTGEEVDPLEPPVDSNR